VKLGMSIVACPSSIGLLEVSVAFHLLCGVDHIFCFADNPNKELVELLLNIRRKYYPKFDFDFNSGPKIRDCMNMHSFLTNKAVDLLKKEGCDWVICSDDDEFYDCSTNLKTALAYFSENNVDVLYTNGYCYYETDLDDKEQKSVPRRICYRETDKDRESGHDTYGYKKAIFRTRDFVSVTLGNHFVNLRKINPLVITSGLITIRHYTFRSKINVGTGILCKSSLTEAQIKEKKLVYDDSFKKKLISLGL